MTDIATTHREIVKISGRGALVNIQVDDGVPVKVACRELRERLGRDRGLYSQGEVVVDIGQRILSDPEQERIRKVIEAESGLIIKQFWCDTSILALERERINGLMDQQARTAERVNGSAPQGDAIAPETPPEYFQDGESTGVPSAGAHRQSVPADIVRGTCRAGEVMRFPGNVVVMGNVNPGAQIIAQGDIMVFGTLRGTAHAGAGGDSTAVILAMSAISPQLRIADFVAEEDTGRAVAGRRTDETDEAPVIARVQNRTVRVSPYLKNHSIDHGGNPNER